MGSFHNWQSKRSLPLTLLGIERGMVFGLEGEEGETGELRLTLSEVEA